MDSAATLARVALQTVVIYTFLILALATVGRQQMAQLTLLDYLIIALLGSAVETGLYFGRPSLSAGLVSAATLMAADRLLRALVRRYRRLWRLIVGVPLVLVQDGRIVGEHLRQARLTEDDLSAALRLRGYDSLENIRFAVLEPGGEIAVVPRQR